MKFNYCKETVKQNMEDVLIQADYTIYQEAMNWYPKAKEYAAQYAKKYDTQITKTAGVIAVLSPQKNWWENLRLTEDFLKNGKCGHMGRQLDKAGLIMRGNGTVSGVEWIINGLKTRNFYRNILFPEDNRYGTIDFHMAQLMSGDMHYKAPTDKQYEFLKNTLIEFANDHKIPTTEMQSILWLTWRIIKPKRL